MLVVVAATLGVLAVQWGQRAGTQSRLADRQSRLATSRYLVTEADARQGSQADLSILLSVAAFRMAGTTQARDGLIRQVALHRDVQILLTGHNGAVDRLAFSPDGRMLASGGGTQIILWDVARRMRIGMPLPSRRSRVGAVAFSPDGRVLATGEGNQIVLWDVARRMRLGVMATSQQEGPSVTSLALSRDGRMLASASAEGGNAVVWDVARRARLGTVPAGPSQFSQSEPAYIANVVFGPDGRTLIGATSDGQAVLWDTVRRTRSGVLTPPGGGGGIGLVALDRNYQMLAFFSGFDGVVYIFDTVRRIPIWAFSHTGEIRSIALSPDGRTLAVGGADKTVTLSDIRHPGALAGHAEFVQAFVFSPDGRTLATGGSDKKVILWDVARRIPQGPPLTGHTGAVIAMAFSPDGRVLASSEAPTGTPRAAPSSTSRRANRIILWDVATRTRPHTIVAGGDVTSLAFSPNGRILASSIVEPTGDGSSCGMLFRARASPLSAASAGA